MDTKTLLKSIYNFNGVAMRAAMQYISLPSLAGVSLYLETCVEKHASQISKQIIIDSSGKRQAVSDNFQPLPVGFSMTGFLKPLPYEMTSFFQPSLERQKQKIITAKDSRDPIIFIDRNHKKWEVGIEQFDCEKRAGEDNSLYFKLELNNTPVLTALTATVERVESSSFADQGTEDGQEADTGLFSAQKNSDGTQTSILAGVIGLQ
jgi:hypothetical protein